MKVYLYIYYINANEIPGELSGENMISSHVERSPLLWLRYIIYCAFCNDLVFHCCLYNKQNITWPLGDTKFLFECLKIPADYTSVDPFTPS